MNLLLKKFEIGEIYSYDLSDEVFLFLGYKEEERFKFLWVSNNVIVHLDLYRHLHFLEDLYKITSDEELVDITKTL